MGEAWGWLMAPFFALGIPAAIWLLRPNKSYLRLDEDGLEMKPFFKTTRIKWTEVEQFYVTTMYGNKMVGIRYSRSFGRIKTARRLAAAISGMEGLVPNQFQGAPEEICELLNRWRQRFGAPGN